MPKVNFPARNLRHCEYLRNTMHGFVASREAVKLDYFKLKKDLNKSSKLMLYRANHNTCNHLYSNRVAVKRLRK